MADQATIQVIALVVLVSWDSSSHQRDEALDSLALKKASGGHRLEASILDPGIY